MRICQVEGCGGKHYGLGYCSKHYRQVKTYGRLRPERERRKKVVVIAKEKEPPAVVEYKPVGKLEKPLTLTPAQLVHSSSEVFWAWWRQTNPAGVRPWQQTLRLHKDTFRRYPVR